MIEYIDAFERPTILEVLPSPWNKRASLVIRKERTTVYESLDIHALKALNNMIYTTLKDLGENDVKKI